MNSINETVGAVPANQANRYAHIDAMRALAVSVVVVGHAGVSFMPGDAGVTVFFVISGFIITTVLLREREKTGGFAFWHFYARRALKLAPPFIVAILIPTIIYGLFHPLNPLAVLSQIFFSYNWVQIYQPEIAGDILPGSGVVWSLAVEEQFYIVFAIVWILLVRSRHWLISLFTLSVVGITYSTIIRISYLGDLDVSHFRGTDARLDAIAWGILAALAFYKFSSSMRFRVLGNDWILFGALALLLGSFAIPGREFEMTTRYSIHAIAAALLILYGMIPTTTRVKKVFYRAASLKWIGVVGLASYSIYILHDVLIKGIEAVTASPFIDNPVSLSVLGLIAGITMYFLVEIPSLKLKKRLGL